MPYRTMGLLHARALQALRREEGQGTVEYVGLMLLVAGILTAVVALGGKTNGKSIADAVAKEIKDAIDAVTVDKVNAWLAANKPGPFTIVTVGPKELNLPK
jgi:hypothetical protein